MPSIAVVKLCIQKIISFILMASVPQCGVSQAESWYLGVRDKI